MAHRTFLAAFFSPSCESEITSLTPRRPRAVSERRNLVQNSSASDGPVAMPITSRRPSVFAATAIIVAMETTLPPSRTPGSSPRACFHVGGADPQIGPKAFQGAVEKGLYTLVDVLAEPRDPRLHGGRLWLLEMPVMPMALTGSSTERVETPWI